MKASLPAFREKTATEQKKLFYDFPIDGGEVGAMFPGWGLFNFVVAVIEWHPPRG